MDVGLLRVVTVAVLCLAPIDAAIAGGQGPGPGKGALQGVVSDANHRAVSGAEVWVALPARETRATKTDSAGAYALTGLPTGTALVTVLAPRFDTWNGRVELGGDGSATLDVTLAPAIVVTGLVLDNRGQPIPGVRVRPIISGVLPPASSYPLMADPPASATTDGDGRFLLDRLRPGRHYVVRFQHSQYARRSSDVTAGAGSEQELNVTLDDAAWVTGVVRDADGKPIADALVRGAPDFIWPIGESDPMTPIREDGRPEPGAVARTDAEGRFTLGGFEGGKAVLRVEARGCFTETVPVQLVVRRETAGVEIRLDRGVGAVAGTVVDPKGKPLAAAAVRIVVLHKEHFMYADAGGKFEFAPIASRGDATIGVFATGFMDFEQEGVRVGSLDVKLVMRPAPIWRGLVTDTNGRRLAQVIVAVRNVDRAGHESRRWGVAPTTTYTQSKGGVAFYFPVPRGFVRIGADGFETAELGPYEPASGGSIEGGTVQLSPLVK